MPRARDEGNHRRMIDPQAYSTQQVVDQLDHYGYAVVEGLLDIEKSLDPVVDAMAHHLDDWAHQQVRRGAIGRSFESCSLEERLIELVRRDLPGVAQVLDISLPQGGIRADTPMFLADEVFSLLSQPPATRRLVYPTRERDMAEPCWTHAPKGPVRDRTEGPRFVGERSVASRQRGAPRRGRRHRHCHRVDPSG